MICFFNFSYFLLVIGLPLFSCYCIIRSIICPFPLRTYEFYVFLSEISFKSKLLEMRKSTWYLEKNAKNKTNVFKNPSKKLDSYRKQIAIYVIRLCISPVFGSFNLICSYNTHTHKKDTKNELQLDLIISTRARDHRDAEGNQQKKKPSTGGM